MASYKNATLQGNWWEDRQQEGAGLGARRLASEVKTSARCMPWQLPQQAQAALFTTTTQAANAARLATPPPRPRPPPRAVTDANAAGALAAHARDAAAVATLAATRGPMPAEGAPGAAELQQQQQQQQPQPGHEDRFVSAYRRAFERDRAAALASRPRADFAPDRSFPLRGALAADTWRAATLCEGPPRAGRGGARGEFTRRPAEAGSRYGVSVWQDEYAAGR
ncbi:hypothetical protein Rsub_10722 [Raphidocelis subcapitata]|uniref:Uncharacterized protein n=1 Tax=Raphidocelis subcapitata TaxID=307507 RepID=A0A2V0PCL7_9CHLO|nr:hypothetical protein Rsub_10722 [Raphidocelis subcapitata]|eukprot:GBF97586.1 hypothetical protein Rsub_10722 [Raphidocelis subcapitata]